MGISCHTLIWMIRKHAKRPSQHLSGDERVELVEVGNAQGEFSTDSIILMCHLQLYDWSEAPVSSCVNGLRTMPSCCCAQEARSCVAQ